MGGPSVAARWERCSKLFLVVTGSGVISVLGLLLASRINLSV